MGNDPESYRLSEFEVLHTAYQLITFSSTTTTSVDWDPKRLTANHHLLAPTCNSNCPSTGSGVGVGVGGGRSWCGGRIDWSAYAIKMNTHEYLTLICSYRYSTEHSKVHGNWLALKL